ncbi:PAS/PAC sensor hybrid histidine kinase [Chitinispirillum alkaliphilum]|nr:PAS/PAC sensor hybrid histidine kinase [Chitinispirillum alkaliphilum]
MAKQFFHTPVLVASYWGWTYARADNVVIDIITFLGAAVSILVIVMLTIYYRSQKVPEEKRRVGYVLIAVSIPFILGFFSELLIPLFSIRIPELINISFAVMAVIIGHAVNSEKLFSISPGLVASAVIETMSEGVMVLNKRMKIEIINPMLMSMVEMCKADLLGKHGSAVLDFLHDIDSIENHGHKSCVEMKTRLKKSDGKLFPALVSWSVLLDNRGKPRGCAFVIRDITEIESANISLQSAREELEQKVEERTAELTEVNSKLRLENHERIRAERHLKAEQDKLSVTLRSIRDGVIATDKDGMIMLFNDAAAEMTGVEISEACGRHLREVYEVYEITKGERVRHYPENKSDSTDFIFKSYEIHSKQAGMVKTISETSSPINDPTGEYYGSVIVFSDITDRKKIEEELFKSRKLESLSILASGIANEFSTLLSGIITNLFMAKIGLDISSETSQLITAAEKAAFNASGLINQLLTFARSGMPEREITSLKELIENSVGYYMNGLDSEYNLQIDDDLYEVEVDRGQIDQVLNNIILNADQAMPLGGTVTISASNYNDETNPLLQGTAGPPWVKVIISDNGPGIPSDILTRIFDPYFTTRENNVGLGLTMAYSTIRNHGGQITIDSEPGSGTSIQLYFPALIKEKEEEDAGEREKNFEE